MLQGVSMIFNGVQVYLQLTFPGVDEVLRHLVHLQPTPALDLRPGPTTG